MKRILTALVLLGLCWNGIAKAEGEDPAWERLHPTDPKLTQLEAITATPESFRNTEVVFEARYHRMDNLFVSVYTPFSSQDYINFSVWDDKVKLWTDEVATDFPLLYAPKGDNFKAVNFATEFSHLKKYEKLRIAAKIAAVFDGRPYLEVISIVRLEKDEVTSEKGLLFINLAEKETAKESYTEAAKLYLNAIDAGLCKDFQGMCYRRAGELNYKIHNYERALELLELARKRIPNDSGLDDVIAIMKHIITNEETGNVPADLAQKDAEATAAANQDRLGEVERELERLRGEITELSNQKIDLLQQKSALEEELNKAKSALMSQKEMEMLREDLRRLQETSKEQQPPEKK